MEYEKHHIMDINIEDETQRNGRDITVYADTYEMVDIHIGNTVTIRTDEAGIDDLREALHRALVKLEEVRYSRCNEMLSQSEDEMIQAGIDARESAKSNGSHGGITTWNPNDPANW